MDSNEESKKAWATAMSLGQYVAKLVQEGKTESPEFLTLVGLFGKEKLREFYKKALANPHQENADGPKRTDSPPAPKDPPR